MRAIIVEPRQDAADAVLTQLRALQYDVVPEDILTTGSRVLLALARRPPPDLLIVNLDMKGAAEGIDIVHMVKYSGLCPRTNVIAVTSAQTQKRIRQAAEQAGAICVTAPFTEAQLSEAAALATTLRLSSTRSQVHTAL